MSVYAFIYILGHPKSKKKTVVDKNCGTRPRWNNKMSFPIEERTITIPGLTLLVQIKAKKFCRDNKVLGEVYILIPELFQRAGIVGNEEQNGERVIDYQVNTLSGRGKGNLKIAYAFGEKSSYDIIDDVGKSKTTNQPIIVQPPLRDHNEKLQHIPRVSRYEMGAPKGYLYYHQGGYYILPQRGYANYLPLGMYPLPVHGAGLHGGMSIGNMMPNVEEMAALIKGSSNTTQSCIKELTITRN
ncbi:hypothetical protein Leryth_016060 [Lithospermum erythrorhizon]|nr:hypothetical protein Leryth_016060 [Lithospermum erythrorhizon]